MILSIKDKEKVVDLYNSGMSQAQVGKALGVSDKTIWKFMNRHNIKARPQGLQMKQLQNSNPVKTRELISEAKSVDINYTTIQFRKKYTQFSDELNLYIPEKWNVNKIW